MCIRDSLGSGTVDTQRYRPPRAFYFQILRPVQARACPAKTDEKRISRLSGLLRSEFLDGRRSASPRQLFQERGCLGVHFDLFHEFPSVKRLMGASISAEAGYAVASGSPFLVLLLLSGAFLACGAAPDLSPLGFSISFSHGLLPLRSRRAQRKTARSCSHTNASHGFTCQSPAGRVEKPFPLSMINLEFG